MATLLVIEDEDVMRSMLATTLRFHGHTVIEARDGLEGLDRHALGVGEFDLVICDLMLPRVGGMELIRRLRTRAPKLPLLIVSGATHTLKWLRRTDDLAPSAILQKPFLPRELVSSVDALLAQGTVSSGAESEAAI